MIKLSIPDMSCGHCKTTVTAALTIVPGVASVDIDLGQHRAEVEGNATLGALLAALEQAGYPSVPVG